MDEVNTSRVLIPKATFKPSECSSNNLTKGTLYKNNSKLQGCFSNKRRDMNFETANAEDKVMGEFAYKQTSSYH